MENTPRPRFPTSEKTHRARVAKLCSGRDLKWENLFTEVIPGGYGTDTWVKDFLERNGYSSAFRGEQMYVIARKRSALLATRYPRFLYEG